jgi:hypothetical protein
MISRVDVMSATGARVATIGVGEGSVVLEAGGPEDGPVREYLGFRTPAREAALQENAARHGHRFVVVSPDAWNRHPVGAAITAEQLLELVEWQYGGRPGERCDENGLHQAFLDVLFTVPRPDGRLIRVGSFEVWSHYRTILEGSPTPHVNKLTREHAEAGARLLGEPLLVVEPQLIPLRDDPRGLERYPRCACAATLSSAPLGADQSWSALTLLWWVERLDRPWPAILTDALAGVDWARHAADVHFW